MRRPLRCLSVSLALASIGCSTTYATTTAPSTAPSATASSVLAVHREPAAAPAATVIFVVRHAEKAKDGTKDPPLTPEGTVRAACLARMLGEAGVTHVFSTELQRTRNTVAAVAAAIGKEVRVVPAADLPALLAALEALAPGSVAVVAGHSNTVPQIAQALGAPMSGLDSQGYIDDDTYDRLVEIVIADGASPTLVQLRYCTTAPA